MVHRHHQHQRERGDHVERDEALGRMVGEIGIDRGGDRHLPGGADQHRVTIGGCMRRIFGGNSPAGARLVLDDGGGAGVLLELVHHQAREDIVAAAGGKTDDEADDAVGIGVLRARFAGDGQNQYRREASKKAAYPHLDPPLRSLWNVPAKAYTGRRHWEMSSWRCAIVALATIPPSQDDRSFP